MHQHQVDYGGVYQLQRLAYGLSWMLQAYRAFKYVAFDTASNNGEAKPSRQSQESYEGGSRGVPPFERRERWGTRRLAALRSLILRIVEYAFEWLAEDGGDPEGGF
jgi:hypothetical protein